MSKELSMDAKYIFEEIGSARDFQGSSVLITGCLGFLGVNFLRAFSSSEYDLGVRRIIGVDNFVLGEGFYSQYENEFPKLELHKFDISKDKISDIVSKHEVDYVLHLASIASPTFYRKFPIETVDSNIWGLRNLLDFFKGSSLKGFCFFSSSEIYGDPPPDQIPTNEDYRGNVSQLGPRACYDESKRFGETLCYLFNQQYEMPITVVRPFNNYGPGMSPNDKRLPADLAKAVLSQKDIVLHSSGGPTRTFCYVADAIVGYLKALTYQKFDCFNIGNDSPEISVREFAEIFRQVGERQMGYKGAIRFEKSEEVDYLENNPIRRCPDMRKSKELLGFEAKIPLEKGISRYLRFLQENG